MDCDKVKEIPSIDESIPNCERLILRGLENLKKMPAFPPNLTSLGISNIPLVNYFSEDDFLKKEERNQSKLEAVKQIAEDVVLRLRTNFESNVENFFLLVKHGLEAASEWEEILKFDHWNKDYSREQLLDAWVKFMHCHMETMLYKNEESKLVLPSSLTCLKISSCSITDDALSTCIQCLVSLSKPELSFIQTITSLPPKEVLCSLKHLKSLTIKGCYLLSSLGGIGALTSLVELKLWCCPNLNISDVSLPSSLEELNFYYCSNADVIHARNVTDVIRAFDVGNLSLLKELVLCGWDGHLERLNSLTSLQHLVMWRSPEINPSSLMDKLCTSALRTVSVDNPLQLKWILSNETISSIKTLYIAFFKGDYLDDEVFESLVSLTSLWFSICTITHLPMNLKNLASLQYMNLDECPNLCELAELPRNLRELRIKDCPILTEEFKKGDPNFNLCDISSRRRGESWFGLTRFAQSTTVIFPTEEEGNRF